MKKLLFTAIETYSIESFEAVLKANLLLINCRSTTVLFTLTVLSALLKFNRFFIREFVVLHIFHEPLFSNDYIVGWCKLKIES